MVPNPPQSPKMSKGNLINSIIALIILSHNISRQETIKTDIRPFHLILHHHHHCHLQCHNHVMFNTLQKAIIILNIENKHYIVIFFCLLGNTTCEHVFMQAGTGHKLPCDNEMFGRN